MSWWESLTQAQATVISGSLTFVAALGGVLLAWILFSSKVRDLRGALQESQKLLDEHRESVSLKLGGINEQLSSLDAQVSSTLESVGRIGATVGDLDSAQSTSEPENPEQDRRNQMREKWSEIRDHLESMAASEDIDGRTRAKYGRIDRRNYMVLLDSMAWDDNLGPHSNALYRAVQIWHRFRNGRNTPTAADITEMEQLRSEIKGARA